MSIQRVYDFTPIPTFESWMSEYRSEIRVGVDWDLLCGVPDKKRKIEVGQVVRETNSQMDIKTPWYEGGEDHKIGVNIRVEQGFKPFMVRVPAVEYQYEKFLILDGCHRLYVLEPRFLCLDFLMLGGDDRANAFYDLLGKHGGLREVSVKPSAAAKKK